MTPKEYIEKMIDGLEKQGCQSIDPHSLTSNYKSRYRTKDNLKCIVGQGIADDLYKKCFEGNSIRSFVFDALQSSFVKAGGIGLLPMDLLIDLQHIHDSNYYQKEVQFEYVIAEMRNQISIYFGGSR